ncbi:hypothetical protein D3C81_2095000 [compost metagenome]
MDRNPLDDHWRLSARFKQGLHLVEAEHVAVVVQDARGEFRNEFLFAFQREFPIDDPQLSILEVSANPLSTP